MQNFIKYAMSKIDEFYKNQSQEDFEKATQIANKLYKSEVI